MRIGILGGSFNPVHYGHLRSAEEVREALALEQVRFVPLAVPPHKPDIDIATAEARLEMVRLATEDNPAFFCDPIEVERGGVSYTVDTLAALAEGPGRQGELFFIIGADAFSEIHTWRAPERVLRMANFAVTLRREQRRERVVAVVRETMERRGRGIEFKEIGDNMLQIADSKFIIHFFPISNLDISATTIRERAARGESLRYLLPPKVEVFIIQRQLYGAPGSALR